MIRLLGVIVVSIWLYGCGQKAAEAPAAAPAPIVAEPAQTAAEPVVVAPPDAVPAAPATTRVYEYRNGEIHRTAPAAEAAPPAVEPVPTAPVPAPAPVAAAGSGKGAWGDMPMPRAVPAPVPAEVVPITKKAADVPAAVKKALSAEEQKSLYKYAVKVTATSEIEKYLDPSIKSAGQLNVWVGQPGYEPPPQPGMSGVSEVLPPTETKAVSAKIEPKFPNNPLAFDVEPKTSKCQKVEPHGTEVTFTIIPKQLGEFNVGASVELYGKEGCTGDAITRTANPITVKVVVGTSKLPFYQEIWAAFMKFFKEFLAICFALLLFLFRNKLKKIFSFEKES